MQELKRVGYGSSFNTLATDGNKIQKVAKNEYGKLKIAFEKDFFLYLQTKALDFPIPQILSFEEFGYTMKYYKGWCSFLDVYRESKKDRQEKLLEKVYLSLQNLHTSESKNVEIETVKQDLKYELYEKLTQRWTETQRIIEPYTFVKSVNNIQIESFETILEFLQEYLQAYLENQSEFFYCPIHGDCQFNNILVSPENDALLFIDPRGYFGKTSLFGLSEYDIAKVRFALSGYDVFDNMSVDKLEIEGSNIILPEIYLDPTVFKKSDFPAVLMASIWLGNPHSFKDVPLKAISSSFYARYYATLIYRNVKSLIK